MEIWKQWKSHVLVKVSFSLCLGVVAWWSNLNAWYQDAERSRQQSLLSCQLQGTRRLCLNHSTAQIFFHWFVFGFRSMFETISNWILCSTCVILLDDHLITLRHWVLCGQPVMASWQNLLTWQALWRWCLLNTRKMKTLDKHYVCILLPFTFYTLLSLSYNEKENYNCNISKLKSSFTY